MEVEPIMRATSSSPPTSRTVGFVAAPGPKVLVLSILIATLTACASSEEVNKSGFEIAYVSSKGTEFDADGEGVFSYDLNSFRVGMNFTAIEEIGDREVMKSYARYTLSYANDDGDSVNPKIETYEFTAGGGKYFDLRWPIVPYVGLDLSVVGAKWGDVGLNGSVIGLRPEIGIVAPIEGKGFLFLSYSKLLDFYGETDYDSLGLDSDSIALGLVFWFNMKWDLPFEWTQFGLTNW